MQELNIALRIEQWVAFILDWMNVVRMRRLCTEWTVTHPTPQCSSPCPLSNQPCAELLPSPAITIPCCFLLRFNLAAFACGDSPATLANPRPHLNKRVTKRNGTEATRRAILRLRMRRMTVRVRVATWPATCTGTDATRLATTTPRTTGKAGLATTGPAADRPAGRQTMSVQTASP